MDKPFLPNILNLSEVASELNLNDFTKPEAITRLLKYTEGDDGLKIHISTNIFGYEDKDKDGDNKSLERDIDPQGFPSMVQVDGDVTPVSASNGDIQYLSGYYDNEQEEPLYIHVSMFQQDGINYHSVLDQGHLLYASRHKVEDFYVYRKDLEEFINHMKNKGEMKSDDKLDGVLKALAILAIDYANRSPQFRRGNKVNASAFKDEIISIAEKYEIETYGLRTIDDKINKMLDKLELNVIVEKNNS